MKPLDRTKVTSIPEVAPHAGAWIETGKPTARSRCGAVAPHAGAWIETQHPDREHSAVKVAPHAGAWIETCKGGKP